MYEYSKIKRLQLELTNKCNAACPQCARNWYGSKEKRPDVGEDKELTLADIQAMIPTDFLQQLEAIGMSGIHGDPMMVHELQEICAWFKSVNPKIYLKIFTNGGARGNQWWTDLAKVVDEVEFAIDGMADTNHLYRRNVRWDKVISHANAYIQAGGTAIWSMIVFKHNQHQVEECRAKANELGFKRFLINKTGRFIAGTNSINRTPVLNDEGTEVEYFLEPPTIDEYCNDNYLKLEPKKEYPINWIKWVDNQKPFKQVLPSVNDPYLNSTQISCTFLKWQQIHMNMDGTVWPCCWIGIPEKSNYPANYCSNEFFKEIEEGRQSLQSRNHHFKEIIEGKFFQMIANGWNKDLKTGRHETCALKCGELTLTQKQKENNYFFEFEIDKKETDGQTQTV